MSIRTTLVGSFPKVTETGQDNLPGMIDRWQRQLVGEEALEQEVQKVLRRVIGEQEQAGLDLLTDGQIRWEDLPHGAVRSSKGIHRGALRRFFDNNVYYRRLELNGGIQWEKSAVADEFRFASQAARKPVKVSLPGPLTLLISTEIKSGASLERILSDYAALLRQEVQALEAAGAKEIQLEEPALKSGEPLAEAAIQAINQIFEGVKARRWVISYFHDVDSLLPLLGRLKVEVLGLDLVSAPGLADRLKEKVWKGEVALGLVDARNTKLESADDLARQIGMIAKTVSPDRLWLSPNCGLEFLPHEAAVKKLHLLKQTASRV